MPTAFGGGGGDMGPFLNRNLLKKNKGFPNLGQKLAGRPNFQGGQEVLRGRGEVKSREFVLKLTDEP